MKNKHWLTKYISTHILGPSGLMVNAHGPFLTVIFGLQFMNIYDLFTFLMGLCINVGPNVNDLEKN